VKKLFLLPLLILLVIGVILVGCGEAVAPTTTAPTTTVPTTTAPTTTAPTTTAPTTTQPTSTAPGATKTFTMGFITDLTSVLGNGIVRWQNVLCDIVNARGGLKVGNDRYMMKTIVYSTDNDFNKGVAAINRLIFQDKVQHIISHGIVSADYLCPISQPEKVLTFCLSTIWNSGFLDQYTYNFSMLGQGTGEVAVAGNYLDLFPDMKDPAGGGHGMALACPDNASGHQTASNFAFPYKRLSAQPSILYYPADQRDLSSLGTKIKVLNPGYFIPGSGKVEDMALITAACYDAGYRGKFMHFLTSDVGLLVPIFKPEVLEGYMCSMTAMEYGDYDGCMTQLAADMKATYTAKYGGWDYADYMTTTMFFALVQAIENAGSLDTTAVAAELHKPGMKFDYSDGPCEMITRPDMRLDGAAVDANTVRSIKIVKNKQPEMMTTFTLDQILGYVRKAYPPLAPGQTPTIAPPA
jgi:ABC-type branched-subunit amino acid transport system substrate-binding protein